MTAVLQPACPSALPYVRPLSPDQSRKVVETALRLGAAGIYREAIEQALRRKGCPEPEITRLVAQALQFGEPARRTRREEALRAQTRAARQASGPSRNRGRERAWTLSVMAACGGLVLGAVLWRVWT